MLRSKKLSELSGSNGEDNAFGREIRVVDRFGQSQLNNENENSSDEESQFTANETFTITCESPTGDTRPYARVTIHDEEIIGLLDSGASVTILGKGCYTLVNKLKLSLIPVRVNVSTADGTLQRVSHYVKIPYKFNNEIHRVDTLLSESINKRLIIGTNFWKKFRLKITQIDALDDVYTYCDAISDEEEPPKPKNVSENHNLSEHDLTKLNAIKSQFTFVKEDGPLSYTSLTKHYIETKDAKPIKQKQYVFSPYMQDKIRAELNRLTSRDIIEKVSAPTWLNPVRPVPKKDGNIRLCLDARKLNEVTVKNSYPQQNVNRILGRLDGTKYLTALDLTDAFYQILLDKESRVKTAFSIPGVGTYMYKRMPMGLVNSGATLSELVDSLFGAEFEPECFPYLDDFIIATKTLEKHFEILERVAEKLTTAGLVISAKKSQFCMKRLKYLGHVIDEDGIRADPDKIAPISEYPAPKSVKDVRRFMGLTGWYRRFIKNFAEISVPITNLIKKKNKNFEWTEDAQKAFDEMKKALASAPVLTTPDYSKEFIIQTDASDVGIGGVLTQTIDNFEKVIAYMSQKLSRAQQKYHVTERECLAVLTAVEKFRPYIEGVRFTVITDHASLVWLQNLKDPMGRLARWALRMQAFDFDLKHRKGKLNVVPDAMSRAFEVSLLKVARQFKTSDVWYQSAREKCEMSKADNAKYRLNDENLLHYVNQGSNDAQLGWKICVPCERTSEIVSKYHDSLLAAHAGILRTLARIKEVYYWPNMAQDVEEYVKACSICKAIKPANINQTAKMGEYRDPKEPFRMLALDYIGPLPLTKKQNRFMLVVIDVFSKYVFIKPLKQQSAIATIEYLKKEIFLRFGTPEILVTDNGPQLKSDVFKTFLQNNKVKHWLTANYHPQANPTEAVNKTIVTAIRAYMDDELPHDSWDSLLPEINYALNSSTHFTTKASPNLIVFGKRLAEAGDEYGSDKELDEQRFERIRNKVAAYLKMAYLQNKKRYDLRAREIEFKPGEIVYRRNMKLSDGAAKYSAKLANKFVKAVVLKRVGANTYEIKDVESNKTSIIHTKLLKK